MKMAKLNPDSRPLPSQALGGVDLSTKALPFLGTIVPLLGYSWPLAKHTNMYCLGALYTYILLH